MANATFFRIHDLGSPTHIFSESLEATLILCQLAQIFLCTCSKIKQFQFCETDGYKKGKTTKIFSPPLYCCCWIPNGKKSGSGKNIPDPQHCKNGRKNYKKCHICQLPETRRKSWKNKISVSSETNNLRRLTTKLRYRIWTMREKLNFVKCIILISFKLLTGYCDS